MATTSSLITTAGDTIYTSSGNTVITWLSITNYSAGNVTANVHVVPSAGSANAQNTIISNVLITTGDSLQLYTGNEKLILENNTFVVAVCNANTALNAVTSYTSA
jgi:hypothetical protein